MAFKVKKITTIVEERGGRVSWGDNDMIAYGGLGEDNYYDLWTIKPDGSDAKCLTCGNPKIAQLHNGQPTWHPSGKYIVFQSQDPSLPHSPQFDFRFADPALGMHNNLWATDPKGENFYQLTYIEKTQITLHSHFSHDGKKLTWTQNLGVMIADFVETPEPHLENIKEYHPVKDWIETHSFSPDNSKILFTAFYPISTGTRKTRRERNDEDSSSVGFIKGRFRLATRGIREMDIRTQEVRELTNNPNSWDEHAHYSPDGKKIIWASSRGYPYGGETMEEILKTTKLDYWIMDADGSNKQKLTYFNEPGHEHYIGGDPPVKTVDYSWNPDGKKIVACLLRGTANELAKVVIIELTDD